jgi:uncharacterized membrane protein
MAGTGHITLLSMNKARMEAFSDGVMAVIITIMVLELEAPEEATWTALLALRPVLLSYVLSFVFLGIYWSNHHHLLQAVRHVNGRILWANLHLLFWLSLTPFGTAWMGRNFSPLPVAVYGCVLLFAAIAYYILVRALIAQHGAESTIATAVGRDFKGKISPLFYLAGIPLAFYEPRLSCLLYVVVAAMWLVPDKRIERIYQSGG